jgi:uncharacterized protein
VTRQSRVVRPALTVRRTRRPPRSARPVRALVTGASEGIGAGFARALADRGVDLVLVARREHRLRRLGDTLPVDVEVLAADLAVPDGRATVAARLRERYRPVDLLVNNAGFGTYGASAAQDEATSSAMVAVNVTAVVELTHAVLPGLLERGRGGVINVGSTAGFRPNPYAAVYGASKAFVNAFTQAVHEELRGSPVRVLLVAPGSTATGFQRVAGLEPDAVPSSLRMQVEPVVDAALRAFAGRRAVCVPGALPALAGFASDLAPSAVSRRATALVHRSRMGRA